MNRLPVFNKGIFTVDSDTGILFFERVCSSMQNREIRSSFYKSNSILDQNEAIRRNTAYMAT